MFCWAEGKLYITGQCFLLFPFCYLFCYYHQQTWNLRCFVLRSFSQIKNSSGSNIDLCGTPQSILENLGLTQSGYKLDCLINSDVLKYIEQNIVETFLFVVLSLKTTFQFTNQLHAAYIGDLQFCHSKLLCSKTEEDMFLVPITKPVTSNEYAVKDLFAFAKEVVKQNSDLYEKSKCDSLLIHITLEETFGICIDTLLKLLKVLKE